MMSTTYTISCLRCKVKYWCGQSDYLYRSPDNDYMMSFLKDHAGHSLIFTNDLGDTPYPIAGFKSVDKQYYIG